MKYEFRTIEVLQELGKLVYDLPAGAIVVGKTTGSFLPCLIPLQPAPAPEPPKRDAEGDIFNDPEASQPLPAAVEEALMDCWGDLQRAFSDSSVPGMEKAWRELHQRLSSLQPKAPSHEQLLATALRDVLARAGVLRPGVEASGPELLVAAEDYCQSKPSPVTSERLADFLRDRAKTQRWPDWQKYAEDILAFLSLGQGRRLTREQIVGVLQKHIGARAAMPSISLIADDLLALQGQATNKESDEKTPEKP